MEGMKAMSDQRQSVARFFYRDPAAPIPNRPPRLGVVALIEREGTLLLDRRSDSGRWALIGGAIEADESFTDALRREVDEETGLTIGRLALFGTFSDPSRIAQYPDGNTVRIITLAYIAEVEPFDTLRPSVETTALRFFSQAALPDLDIVETHRHIVDRWLSSAPVVLD